MRSFAKSFQWRILAGVSALALAGAITPARAEPDGWEFTIAPYLWLPAVDSTFRVDNLPLNVDTDATGCDILDKLDFAALVCGEVRKGKLSLLYDLQYIKLGDEGAVEVLKGREYDSELILADATLGLAYRVIDTKDRGFSLDGFGGARTVYVKASLDLRPLGAAPTLERGQEHTWVDPIVGLKCQWRFAEHWSLIGYADCGGFGVGSDFTWQAMGAVSYHFTEHVALVGAYRCFFVDYGNEDLDLKALLHGPLIGLSFSF